MLENKVNSLSENCLVFYIRDWGFFIKLLYLSTLMQTRVLKGSNHGVHLGDRTYNIQVLNLITHLNPVKYLVHELHTLILVFHLPYLQRLDAAGDESVEGYKDYHHRQPGQDRGPEDAP